MDDRGQGGGSSNGVVDGLSLDTVHRVLSHSSRRVALTSLDGSDEPLSLAEVAEEVVRRNGDGEADEVDIERVESCYQALYHLHVPKLIDNGLVRREREYNTLVLTETGAQLAAVQEELKPFER